MRVHLDSMAPIKLRGRSASVFLMALQLACITIVTDGTRRSAWRSCVSTATDSTRGPVSAFAAPWRSYTTPGDRMQVHRRCSMSKVPMRSEVLGASRRPRPMPGSLLLSSQMQQPLSENAVQAATEVLASALAIEQKYDRLPAPSEEQPLSERVLMAVQTIQRRKQMFRQYAKDIQGRTGLGGIAALSYCRQIINRRESVWGDLVMIVFESQQKAVEQIVLQAARETLTAPIERKEWIWFRDNLLSTFLWFELSAEVKGRYLYERLLDIATEQLQVQAIAANRMAFPLLEDIPSKAFLPGGSSEIRQDHRLVGNVPNIRQQLLGSEETSKFYDLNVYLNDLLCIARIIDPDFQAHLVRLMSPLGDRALVEAGPLKSLRRCRAKVEGEYASEQWPTSAHLLDLVRVSVTFGSEEDLRVGLGLVLQDADVPVAELLAPLVPLGAEAAAAKLPTPPVRVGAGRGAGVAAPQPPSRFAVARLKNGFAKRSGYRDVKLNVIYQSQQGFAMICEVALCLEQMSAYKNATHELYEILRERDFFAEVSQTLGNAVSTR